jgi:citrate synthase
MNSGLEGVVAAETVLIHLDGARGILWLRGHGLAEVVTRDGYERATALLWEGFAGDGLDRAGIRAQFGARRATSFARLPLWIEAARKLPLGKAMRLAIAAIPDESPPPGWRRRRRWRWRRCCARAPDRRPCRPIRRWRRRPISCARCTASRRRPRSPRRSTPISPR